MFAVFAPLGMAVSLKYDLIGDDASGHLICNRDAEWQRPPDARDLGVRIDVH
jgi:hypothetical protein